MKFLLLTVAIMTSHPTWGAFPEVVAPPKNSVLGGECGHEVRGSSSLEMSLYSPGVADEDDGLARSIQSPPPNQQGSGPTDVRSNSANSTDDLPLSSEVSPASGGQTPKTDIATPLVLGSMPPMDTRYVRHFSTTTYDLLVRGLVHNDSRTYSVPCNGSATPFLDYIQRILTASLDEINELSQVLALNLKAAAMDFQSDCHAINPKLHLTDVQAHTILTTLIGDLLSIFEDQSIPYLISTSITSKTPPR